MRYAIYYTPPQDDPLTRAAVRWLGRDAFTGETMTAQPVGDLSAAEVAYHTASARRYGFHATMKAPFVLADGMTESDLVAALDAFAASVEPVRLPAVRARQIDGFFAIVPAQRSEALDRLAGDVVMAFERFRAPMREVDIARRNPDALTPSQLRHLHRWGYPYVFDEFRFHMTLSGRVAGTDATRIAGALDAHFGVLLSDPLEIASIALFVEMEPGAPFAIRSFRRFERREQRKTA